MADFEFWTLVAYFEFWTLVADLKFRTLVVDVGFWTLVADLRFRTLVVDVGFWVVMAYFGFWPLVADYLQIIDIVKRRLKLLKHSEYFFLSCSFLVIVVHAQFSVHPFCFSNVSN